MNQDDLVKILPALYNKIRKPKSRYEILKILGIPTSTQNYKKIDECRDMGFLKCDTPNQFTADRERIWDFWNKTPIGKEIFAMFDTRVHEPID